MPRLSLVDGLKNLVANLNTPRDKASHSYFDLPVQDDAQLANAYRGAWLPRKIVDIPALDSCRNWRGWQAEAEEVSALESEENRLALRGKLLDGYTKARLFGGAALYIGTNDRDPSQPLRPERIGKGGLRHVTVLTKRVLTAGDIDKDPESASYGLPAFYTMSTNNAAQVKIHPSRLVILQGAQQPDPELSVTNTGWGDSVLLAVMEEIKRAEGTSANIASLVFEAKIDVINIPNLMQNLADPVYEGQLFNRLQLAAIAKGNNGMMILDEGETYTQKSANFSNLRDILLSFMQLVSGAADIPVTRLLGQSPAGLNSSGAMELNNYYDHIRSIQELKLTPAMHILDECLIRSALGDRPAEVFYNWHSLWQTTDKERADIGKTVAESIKIISETGLIPEDVMSKVAINMLTEVGAAPGLESAMMEYEIPDDGAADDDERAALGIEQNQ